MKLTKRASDLIEDGLNVHFREETNRVINSVSIIKQVQKGTTLLHQGELAEYLCYIIKGVMRGYYIDSDGNDITKCFTSEKNFVCTERLRKDGVAGFSVESIENSLCILIPYDIVLKIIDEDTKARQLFEEYSLKALCYFEKREEQLLTLKAKDRYEIFKQEYGHIEERIALAHIASYIGVRPSSLSRLRRSIN